jgi:flagellar biosynthesis/type III secretory pathway protein FliH
MKLSNAVLLATLLTLGVGVAAAQDRDGRGWDNHDAYLQTVQYNGGYRGGADYQRGYQDGINSGRADANDHKRFDLDSHPYYTNSNDQAYREGFAQGYHEAYGEDRGHPNEEFSHVNTNNPEYQKGLQDGINSGRADANSGKRPDADAHPYYRNSNNESYRAGFMQGYRDAYGRPR